MNQANRFRVALSGSFQTDTGEPVFPMFDLSPLVNDPDIEFDYVYGVEGRMTAQSLEDFDALILLLETFDADSIPLSGRLSIVARFGVGYDTVDVEAMTSVTEMTMPKREDRITDGQYPDKVLANAPDPQGLFYTVPKVVD